VLEPKPIVVDVVEVKQPEPVLESPVKTSTPETTPIVVKKEPISIEKAVD
jgi:hypothetical protein